MNRPTPARMDAPLLSLAEVDRHRDLDCPHYDACLHVAQDWQGMSCRGCPMGRLAGLEPPRWTKDVKLRCREEEAEGEPVVAVVASTGILARAYDLLRRNPLRIWSGEQVAQALRMNARQAFDALGHLYRRGEIERVRPGYYRGRA